ncbi:MAG: hypothetical protein JOZ73_12085 [Solirubrobacterales bacterium]|nr:hypothetical protein [Solirubrobacterales bacterium]
MDGRPSLLTDERALALIASARRGLSRRAAAGLAGIGKETLHNWLRRGFFSHEQPYWEFAKSYLRAESEAEAAMTDVLFADALKGNAKSALEWLIRRRKGVWSDKLPAPRDRDDAIAKMSDAEVKEAIRRELEALTREDE